VRLVATSGAAGSPGGIPGAGAIGLRGRRPE
jgi:hypothetical protein